MATAISQPVSRTGSPGEKNGIPQSTPQRFSTPPPPPPAGVVPKDFRTSLSAWWNNSSYKEARIAEERLLRRMAMYEPPSQPLATKGWLGWSAPSYEASLAAASKDRVGEEVVSPVSMSGGLVATLRNVFIPTPNPNDAPSHPADPRESVLESSTSVNRHHSHHHKLHNPLKKRSQDGNSAASSSSSLPQAKGELSESVTPKSRTSPKLVDYINTMEISSPENAHSKEAVVVLHGYAAAMGFFFRNWDSIAQSANSTGRRAFFLDWLGMGLSSRPSPSLLSSPSGTPIPSRVSRAEHFFLSSLESWRSSEGIDKMILVGHSLGGYLASAYAVRYPERVSGLVLVSPAGIPRGPEYQRFPLTGENNGKNGGNGSIGMNVDKGINGSRASLDEAVNAAEEEINGKPHEAKGEAKNWSKDQTLTRKYMMKFFVWGWEKGLSPFSILRSMGPWAPMFAGRYASRRFAAQDEQDIRDLHAYIYNTSILKGSGEYCISHILAPGAYARIPIVDRINRVKVPVTFLYGDNDWMDVDGGKASLEELRKAGNNNSSVHVVKKAGHHVYLDNPEDTNQIIGDAIRAVGNVSPESNNASI